MIQGDQRVRQAVTQAELGRQTVAGIAEQRKGEIVIAHGPAVMHRALRRNGHELRAVLRDGGQCGLQGL